VSGSKVKVSEDSPGSKAVVRQLAEAFFELMIQRSIQFQTVAAEIAMSPIQAKTLFELEPGRDHMMSEVAEAAHCGPSNLTGIIDKLEARGLVERRGATDDRRIRRVSLTREGAALRRRLIARLNEPAEWMLALSAEDQRHLRDIFKRALEPSHKTARVA
jgi:DNA-binding MarR family transcriptional regulator